MDREALRLPCKGPSFSSSLLDAVYRSIDETERRDADDSFLHRRNNIAPQVEEDIESLRRAIMIEKWIQNHKATTTRSNASRHFPSNSTSSTDSSLFSSSETESSSVSRSSKTKSRGEKIYGDTKKVKEPNSPGGKLASFFNSIFSPRNLIRANQGLEEWRSSMRKSRSMKDTKTCSLASRSCLSKNPSSGGSKSKRSVRFCPVNVILDEYPVRPPAPIIGSQFIKKNIDSLRLCEENNNVRDYYENELDVDDLSCGSSDLFELESIGRVGIGTYDEELPVYETTNLEMNL